MMGSSGSHNSALETVLTIVTNPKLVEENIKQLKANVAALEKTKADAIAAQEGAKDFEAKNKATEEKFSKIVVGLDARTKQLDLREEQLRMAAESHKANVTDLAQKMDAHQTAVSVAKDAHAQLVTDTERRLNAMTAGETALKKREIALSSGQSALADAQKKLAEDRAEFEGKVAQLKKLAG